MEFYEDNDAKSQSSSKHSRKRSTSDMQNKNVNKKNTFQIFINKIGFKYQDYSKVLNEPSIIEEKEKLITLMDFEINRLIFVKV